MHRLPLATTLKDKYLKQFRIILATCIVLTACDNNRNITAQSSSKNYNSRTKPDSTFQDSIVLLNPNPHDIHISGSITKVVYPSKNLTFQDSLADYFFDCLGNKLKIHVPCNYLRTDYLQYTEGQILIIHYPDSSTISILCGTMTDLGVQDKKTIGLYDKKVIVKDYQITYANVPEQRLKLFNYAFELLDIDIK